MEKEKDSKLKQAMKGLDSFLTTHYSFRYNQITEQCEFHDKHKFDKYRVVDEREFNTLVINAIEEGVNCMDRDMRRYLGSSRIPSFSPRDSLFGTSATLGRTRQSKRAGTLGKR